MPFRDHSGVIGFGSNPLNRLSEIRQTDSFIAEQRCNATTRFLVFLEHVPVLAAHGGGFQPLFSLGQLAGLGTPAAEIYLGREELGSSLFAISFGKECLANFTAHKHWHSMDLRSIALSGAVTPAVLGAMGGASAVLNWHRRHGYCPSCGAPSKMSAAGWRRDCAACGTQHFPRVDPVVIMLAIRDEHCLLGRQPRFAAGMYSALAGFLEPGETIEDAVRREIREESGVACSQVGYYASQPWPFPSTLMIGCFAQALDEHIVVDTTELEDARWFSRDEAAHLLSGDHAAGLMAPKPYTIAHHLLKAFVQDGPGVLTGQQNLPTM